MDDSIQLISVTNAMIVGFALPKRLASPLKDQVCGPCGKSLDPSHHSRQWLKRAHYQVDVIRHDYPGESFVETVLVFSAPKSFSDFFRDAGISEPERSRSRAIQNAVASGERSSGSVVLSCAMRLRPIETPRREDNRVRRIKVREISFVVTRHKSAGQTAYATNCASEKESSR